MTQHPPGTSNERRMDTEARLRALAGDGAPAATDPKRRLLDTAFVLFYRQGIRAVGVDLLIAEAQIAKATFYRHFPAKADLVTAYVEERSRCWLTWLREEVAEAADDPRQRLLAVFDAVGAHLRDVEHRGCAVTNAVAELGDEVPAVLEVARRHEAELEALVAGLAADAGCPDPELIGRWWRMLVDAAYVSAQRHGGDGPAREARAVAERILSG